MLLVDRHKKCGHKTPPALPSLPTESKDDTQSLPTPSLQVPHLGTIGPGKSLEVVPARPQDIPKEDPVGAQE